MIRLPSNTQSAILSCAIAATLAAAAAHAIEPGYDVVPSDVGGNTAMGLDALFEVGTCSGGYACDNTAAGAGAMYAEQTGSYNAAFGFQSLNNNTTGSYNTASGFRALIKNTSGNLNTAVGSQALYSNTTAQYNVAIGSNALYFNNGGGNTAIGFSALQNNTSGYGNTAVGDDAVTSNSSGNSNTGIGDDALASIGTGSQNTAVGASTLIDNVTGSNNVALGYGAGESIQDSNNVDIANGGSSSDSGVIRIGTANTQTKTYISGIENSKITGAAVYVTSSGQLGVLASSERYKDRIATMGEKTSKLADLRPVTFHLKSEPKGNVQYGLIAEEVVKVYPELVIRDESGAIQGVRYDELAPMLLNEVQKQQHKLASQEARLAAQDAKLQAQDAKLAKLEQMNATLQAALSDLVAKDQRVAMR
jgi:hypothetical protein